MSADETPDVLMSEEEFEELEAVLVSEEVPADCMNLEMLDGFLAAVVCAPEPMLPEKWLPAVWTAEGESADFASGAAARRALTLVLRYYNDVLASMGSEEDGWEPFCYAADGPDSPALGDEWVAGFEQGVELWPDEWTAGLDSQDAAVAEGLLAHVFKPWGGEDAANATAEVRLEWLEASAQGARGLYALWREVGLPEPQLAPVEIAQASTGGPGRNETCPCGSGKKYKKCCGAEV